MLSLKKKKKKLTQKQTEKNQIQNCSSLRLWSDFRGSRKTKSKEKSEESSAYMDTDHTVPWSLCLGLYSTHFTNLFYLLKTSTWTNSLGKKKPRSKRQPCKVSCQLIPFFSVHRSRRPDPALAADSKVLHWFLQPLDMTHKINARSKRSRSPQASTTCWAKTDVQMPAHSEIKPPTIIKLIS